LGVLALIFLIDKRNYQEYVVSVLAFFMVLFMLTALFVNLFPLQADTSLSLFGRNFGNIGKALPGLFSLDEFNRTLFENSMDGYLLKFGWTVFMAAKFFYFVWRTLVVLSFVGILVYAVKYSVKAIKRRSNNIPRHMPSRNSGSEYFLKLLAFFVVAVFFQLTALWTYYGSHNIMTQGRYFFQLVIPVTFLFILGVKTLFDALQRGAGRKAIAALVLLMFFFLNYCIWQYMIPVFHWIIKSAQRGI